MSHCYPSSSRLIRCTLFEYMRGVMIWFVEASVKQIHIWLSLLSVPMLKFTLSQYHKFRQLQVYDDHDFINMLLTTAASQTINYGDNSLSYCVQYGVIS